jgi:CrcB protein
MLNLCLIMLGGAIGTGARFGMSALAVRLWGETFPWGTIIVNVTGCLAIGVVAATGNEGGLMASPAFRQFFMIGVCGGYTTFSSFGLQTLNLAQNGEWLKAGGNIVLSVIVCLIAVWLGQQLALAWTSAKGA